MDFKNFPNLGREGFAYTSPEDPKYNCIAFAAGETHRHWWPAAPLNAFWPDGISDAETVEAFVDAYRTLGYEPCANGDHEQAVEKIVLYVNAKGVPTHAAKQIGPNQWQSKIGHMSEDISHTLRGLEDGLYGTVHRFLSRRGEVVDS